MRILIVDDEPLVRSYIRSLLEGEEGDANQCMEAASAAEALRLLARDEPEIALLDVRMPGMSGVELVGRIAAAHPNVACIMLSGHDDFAYVRDAMTHGAQDYLLKHRVTRPVLLAAVRKAQANRLEKLQADARVEALAQQAHVALSVMQGRMLRAAIAGEAPDAQAAGIWQALCAALSGKVHMAVIEVSKTDMKVEARRRIHRLHERVQVVVQEALGKGSPVLSIEENRYAVLVGVAGEAAGRDLRKACNALRLFLNLRAETALSDPFDTMERCADMYAKAVGILATQKPLARLSIDHAERLISALASRNELYLQMACAQVFRHFDGAGMEEWNKITEELLSLLWVSLEQEEADGDTILYPFVESLRACESPAEAPRILTGMMMAVLRAMGAKHETVRHSQHIELAMAHISANYATPLTLEGVAAKVSVSPAYLSRLFREECGCTFTEYVNRLRVDLAGRYLRRGKSAKEAAQLVGFLNQSYFFRVFKHIKGCTPAEFVKS